MDKLKNIIVGPGITIKQALKRMDDAGEKTLLVADANQRLLGTVTDGDIRRWILQGKRLHKSVALAMNKSPFILKEGFTQKEAKDLFVSKVIECVPILDVKRRIVSALRWPDLFEGKPKEYKPINLPVVIMAGGEGARLSPFTNILPKALIPIGDKPIIELIIDKFMQFSCPDIFLSVNYKSNILKAYFSDIKRDFNITYIEENKPLGTIGSLYLIRNRIKKHFS